MVMRGRRSCQTRNVVTSLAQFTACAFHDQGVGRTARKNIAVFVVVSTKT